MNWEQVQKVNLESAELEAEDSKLQIDILET